MEINTNVTSRDRILEAVLAVLSESGLTRCSVDRIAERAQCAKGLVNYHFTSKQTLLLDAASKLRERRLQRRLSALSLTGTVALDSLWHALTGEVDRGEARAWITFQGDPASASAVAWDRERDRALAQAASRALGLEPGDVPPGTLAAALEGFQLLLLRGRPRAEVREAYDRFWLSLMPE